MNINVGKIENKGTFLNGKAAIHIENRGDSVIGARVFIDVPDEYVEKGLFVLNGYLSTVKHDGYYRYQIDINIPIFGDRNVEVGYIVFNIENKKAIYKLPFEIYAEKMARRNGVIEFTANGKNGADAVSDSYAVIKRKDLVRLFLGRCRWHSFRKVRFRL